MSGRGSERRKSSGSGSAVTEDGIEEAISVSVRVRPLNARELKSNTGEAWKVAQEESTISSGDDMLKYTFDNVFNTAATTANVYNKVARDLVSSVLQGMNGTVFAYGQTASGKTFTMQGEPQAPGMLGLAAQQVFEEIQSKPHYQFLLNVSYIEIYNEQVKDLLSDSDNNLRIREDRDKGFFVDGLTTKSVVSVEELLQAREEGERRRHVGETNMNARSSRSHTVFTLKIEMRDSRGMFDQDDEGEACAGDSTSSEPRATDENTTPNKLLGEELASRKRRLSDDFGAKFGLLVGQLNLVDLAGSENARATGAGGGRLKEGGNINKSLLTLSRVISQLAAMRGKAGFINFRDSKLTQILQPSLAGNCRTAIVCCVTPAAKFQEETKSTLSFASRAKQIRTRVSVNEVLDGEGEMRKLKYTIQALRTELASQQDLNAEKTALEEKIQSLKALFLTGGAPLARTSALNDAKDSSKLEPNARVPKKRKKQRETWGPGDFATMTFPGSPQEGESMASIDENQDESEENEDDVTKEFIPEAELPTEVDTEVVITHGNKTSNETQRDDSTGPRAEPIFAAERLVAMQKKVTELKASLEEKAMEAKELEASHAADLAKQEDEHQTAIAKMAESLEVATQNFTEQLKETEMLNAKIQELEQDSKEKAETYQSSKDQIRELLEERTLECADLKEKIATMTEDSKTQSEELRVALKNLQQLKDMEQATADSQSESHTGLRDEINALEEAKATADAEKKELENKIREQEAKFTALETQLASLSKGANSDTHALRTTLEQTEESLRVETQQKVALEAQLAHLQDVLVQAEITRETQLSEIAQEKERADTEANEKAQLKMALENLQIESEQRVAASTALANEELEQVKLEFSSLSAELESREKAGQDTLEVEVIEAELELALSRVEELEQEIENLQEKLAYSQRADELEQKLFETEEKLVSYENDLQLAKEQSEETSSKMLELKGQLEQYTSESSNAKETLQQALQERDALEQTCESLKSELEISKKALDEACVGNAATHDTDSLEAQIELQATALAEKHELLTEKEKLLSAKKEEAETLQKEVERMQTLLCGQEDASKQIQYLERQLEETTVQAMETEDLRSKVNQLSRDLHEAEQALDAAVGSNEEQETASCVSMCLQEILLNIERQDLEDQVKIAQARSSTDEFRTIYEEKSTGEVEDKRLTQVQMQLDLAQQQATQASAVHEEEKAEIQKQTAERDRLISELSAQVEDFQTQLEKAKAEACTSETRASEMEKELGQLKSALEDTEKLSKERLSQAIGDADEEVTEHAQKRISQLELRLSLAEQEKEVAERKLAEVEAARKSLECEAVGDSRELQQRLSEANTQLELAKTEARHASARAEEAREQASDAQRLFEELEQSHKLSLSEVEGLREELAHAKASLENGSAEATATMDENLRSSIEALERKVASLKDTITERDEVIERLNESLDNARAELEAEQEAARTAKTNESLEEQVESLLQSKAELESKVVSMQEELEETTSRLKKVKENTQMIEAERQAQDQRLGELEAQVAAAVDEKSIISLEEELKAMKRLVTELRDNETSAKQGMEQLEAEKLRLVGEMTDLHLRVTQQDAEIRDMKSKEAVASASAQEKAAAAEAATKEVEFLNNKLERAKERVMKLEKVKITKEQASKIQQMKEENRSLKYKYAEAKSSKETLVEAQTKIQERYAIAQEQLVAIQDLVGRTARKFGLLDPIQPSDFVKMMTERLVAIQKERDSLEAHCRDMDGTESPKPEATKAHRTEILSLNAEIEGLRDESKKLRLRLKEFEQDYVKSQEEHSKETEMLRRQMEEQKSEIRFLEKENLSLMVANRKVQDESNSRSSGHKEEPVPHSAKKPLAGIENNILASGGSIRKDRSKSSCSETSYVSDAVKRTAAPSSNKENSIDIDTMSTMSSSNVNDDNKQECATQ